MAIEYAGYSPIETPTDWTGLTDKLASAVSGIGERREKEKEALDQEMRDVESIINDPSIMGKNESFNTIMLDGANEGRTKIHQWNKDLKAGILSPKDYKTRMATLREYWSTLANSAKTFDERYQSILERQQADKDGNISGSSIELYYAEEFGQLANLNNMKFQIADDGRVYSSKIDPNTGQNVGDLIDLREINRPENIRFDRVNVQKRVASLTENWDPYTLWKELGKEGEMDIEDIRQHPSFDIMKNRVAESVAPDSDPKAQLSVLADNGVINPIYYKTEDEFNVKFDQLLKKEKEILGRELTSKEAGDLRIHMVKSVKDAGGRISFELTDDQKKLAKERVKQEADISFGRKETGTPRAYSTGGGGGSGKTEKPPATDHDLYDQVSKAWKMPTFIKDSKGKYIPNQDKLDILSSATGGKYKFVAEKSPTGGRILVKDMEEKTTFHTDAKTLRDLAPYFFGTGTSAKGTTNAYEEFDRQEKNSKGNPIFN